MSKRLAVSFKVYILDLRNPGASPHTPVMHHAAMADDVREFFASENIDHAHLLGHSMGGKVALPFAANNASSIHRPVVVDIAPKAYPPAHNSLIAVPTALEIAAARPTATPDRALAGNIAEPWVRQFLITNLARGKNALLHWRIGLEEFIANYDALTEAASAGNAVATRNCFLRAGRSNFIADDDIPEIRERIPNVLVVRRHRLLGPDRRCR